jgi:Pvc16 N-terminal domain
MADYTVIYDIGNAFIELLRENITPEPIEKREHVGLCDPRDPGDYLLTLYLYHIEENGEMARNTFIPSGDNKQIFAPMALRLHYLMTAHSKSPPISRCADEHKIIGKAMQILRDNPIPDKKFFSGSLTDSNDKISIAFNRMHQDELSKIWSNTTKPNKLSVAYLVAPIMLDSSKTRKITRVMDAEITISQKEGKKT